QEQTLRGIAAQGEGADSQIRQGQLTSSCQVMLKNSQIERQFGEILYGLKQDKVFAVQSYALDFVERFDEVRALDAAAGPGDHRYSAADTDRRRLRQGQQGSPEHLQGPAQGRAGGGEGAGAARARERQAHARARAGGRRLTLPPYVPGPTS
ncbi:unnamed protein product, partial [Prorocentrum cordatum]